MPPRRPTVFIFVALIVPGYFDGRIVGSAMPFQLKAMAHWPIAEGRNSSSDVGLLKCRTQP